MLVSLIINLVYSFQEAVRFLHVGSLSNKVTLGTETDSYDFYPSTPLKTEPVKTAFLEQMCIFVYNDQDFNKWENAKLIQIMGETKQFCISTGTIDYAVCMNTIRRFLFE